MKAPPVMLIKRILLYILLVMLAQSNYQVYGFDATHCPAEIQVKRHSQYKVYIGNSLIVDCPVHYCKKKPVMQWCKLEVSTCMLVKEGKAEWKSKVSTLEFFSVHQNDSGLYRCEAMENLHSKSHGIIVIVEEKSADIITISPENTTGISEEFREAGNYEIWHIICASAPVGLCCPFIIACMFWRHTKLYSKHWHKKVIMLHGQVCRKEDKKEVKTKVPFEKNTDTLLLYHLFSSSLDTMHLLFQNNALKNYS